ncbi:TIGR03571 family LLM class oxidoreductase [Halocalculus aciditolerans]|uniref:N5,N10-methylene tetrahydromethanopterin reductase n=1 Tax=Halocalculus aciditolerans TaxID=1383812 RepID=A0A830FCB5_9EURY|nr:TIGR03571 family LLM class oxidoreductase [Halocalculus aciditolerans]GGL60384.1 N5,N10-methylene tetrahydromethanopterin reductase [Halocalculus aciditolerans]
MSEWNAGYERVFGGDDLTVGVGAPFGELDESVPDMPREVELAQRAEALGYAAVWARDVPTVWPKFNDLGQGIDPWLYLDRVARETDDLALATGSLVLALRHPLHAAKAAASLDRLSGGRVVLGVASGDRPPEYEAFGVDEDSRGERFRDAATVIRAAWTADFPELETSWGTMDGTLDTRPKPEKRIPIVPTGRARQSVDWLGAHGDAWLFYHLPPDTLQSFLDDWRAASGGAPFAMALGVDLAADETEGMTRVNQGYRAGARWLRDYFDDLDAWGVDHVVVSLGGDPERELERFARDVLAER